jgi:hypothetical protein
MHPLGSTLDDYRRAVDSFRWQVPASFNFGRDVVDRWAEAPDRPALLWRDAAGGERRLTYTDVSRLARRAAHLFRGLGVGPGDPVIVMLPRVPEWQAVIVGLLEIGALVVPSSTQLRPKDVLYRATHSGAVAVVASPDCVEAVDAVRSEIPTVRSFLELRGQGSGRKQASRSEPKASEVQKAGSTSPRRSRSSPTTRPRAGRRSRATPRSSTTRRAPRVRRRPCCTTTATRGHSATHRASGTACAKASGSGRPATRAGRRPPTACSSARGARAPKWCSTTAAFEPKAELAFLAEIAPHVFCAPPTEFRLLVKEDLSRFSVPRLRECLSAGEPLNPR